MVGAHVTVCLVVGGSGFGIRNSELMFLDSEFGVEGLGGQGEKVRFEVLNGLPLGR